MSPNGLRRWRAYAKKCRYRSRKEGKSSKATGKTARAIFPRNQIGAPPMRRTPLPPKPFTPRSLVGMTRGAMKRNGVTKDARLWEYLGQKLRPCPGCDTCGGIKLVNGMRFDMYLVICDGSGVLPARKDSA